MAEDVTDRRKVAFAQSGFMYANTWIRFYGGSSAHYYCRTAPWLRMLDLENSMLTIVGDGSGGPTKVIDK